MAHRVNCCGAAPCPELGVKRTPSPTVWSRRFWVMPRFMPGSIRVPGAGSLPCDRPQGTTPRQEIANDRRALATALEQIPQKASRRGFCWRRNADSILRLSREDGMGKPYSMDLRERVVAAIEGGES